MTAFAVVALCLATAPAVSAMPLPRPDGVAVKPATSSVNAYQALLIGSGSSGVEVTQVDTSSGAQQSISPSEFDSLTAEAFAPGTDTAYIAARGSDSEAHTELIPVTVGESGPVQGTPIPIPNADYPGGAPESSPYPSAVAVAPDGQTAYVVDEFNGVVFPVEDLKSGTPTIGSAISGFHSPTSVAVSADGSTVYVLDDNGVNLVDPATGSISSTISIPTGTPASMALSPDGNTAYVTSFTSGASGSEKLYAITLASEAVSLVATLAFSGSDGAQAIAIAPNGETAYVEGAPALDSSDQTAAQVAPVDLRTGTVGSTIDLGTATTGEAYGISITPDGKTVLATESCTSSSGGICQNSGSAYPISTASGEAGTPISVMGTPLAVAITPDEPPVPSFTVTPGSPGSATQFDASASTVAYGSITNYAWDFGDGSPVENTTEPTVSHIYASGGDYTATLTETDSAGSTGEATRPVAIASAPTPMLGTSPSAVDFGLQQAGSTSPAQAVTVTDTGEAALDVSGVSIGGAQTSEFAIASDGCAGQTVAPGASCSLSVTFSPAGAGAASATLELSDNAPGSPQSVALSGIGATAGKAAPPPGTISVPAAPSNGTGTLYGLASPAGVAVTLYRGASSTPAYEGVEGHVFAYTGTGHVESYGSTGEYEISGISPGTYKVEGFSFATGAVDSVSEVTVAADQAIREDVELSHGSGFTGGLSVATGFSSGGPLPMAIVGIPFELSVPLKVTSAPADTIVNERYTLSFGPQTTVAGEASTATYDVLVYYDAKGTPLFIDGHEARKPAPTSAYGPWDLSQASAGLTIAQPLAEAADAAGRGGDSGPDVFNGELTPLVADGGTMNTGVGIDMSYFPPLNATREAHGESEDEYGEDCPPGTHPEKRTTGESLGPEELAQQQTTIEELSEQLTDVEDTLQENEERDKPHHEPGDRGEEESEAIHPPHEREPLSEEEQVELENTKSQLEKTLAELKLKRTFFECVSDPDTQPSGSVYIDPSGKVISSKGVPIAHAKVTLLRSTTAKGKFTPPANGSALMSPSNRRNPDFTDPLGLFGWDVEPGFYKVSASAPGCHAGHGRKAVSTKVFEVPPPVTQIRLELTCPKLKRTAARIKLSTKKHSSTVTVSVSGHGHGAAYGMVTVKLRGKKLATLPLEGGKALVLVGGSGKLTVGYSGDGYYAPTTAHMRIRP